VNLRSTVGGCRVYLTAADDVNVSVLDRRPEDRRTVAIT
jgi:hypothetical protein